MDDVVIGCEGELDRECPAAALASNIDDGLRGHLGREEHHVEPAIWDRAELVFVASES